MDNKVPFRKNQESRSLFSKQTPARDRLSSRCWWFNTNWAFLWKLPTIEPSQFSWHWPLFIHEDERPSEAINYQVGNGSFSHQHPAKSPSSSCTQTSGSGSQCPTGARQHATTINTSNGGYVLMLEPIGMLDKA